MSTTFQNDIGTIMHFSKCTTFARWNEIRKDDGWKAIDSGGSLTEYIPRQMSKALVPKIVRVFLYKGID